LYFHLIVCFVCFILLYQSSLWLLHFNKLLLLQFLSHRKSSETLKQYFTGQLLFLTTKHMFSLSSVSTTVFHVNQDQPVHHQLPSSTCSRTEPLAEVFIGRMSLLLAVTCGIIFSWSTARFLRKWSFLRKRPLLTLCWHSWHRCQKALRGLLCY